MENKENPPEEEEIIQEVKPYERGENIKTAIFQIDERYDSIPTHAMINVFESRKSLNTKASSEEEPAFSEEGQQQNEDSLGDVEDLEEYDELNEDSESLPDLGLSAPSIEEEDAEVLDLEVETAYFEGGKFQKYRQWRTSKFPKDLVEKLGS
jgi:hypothetical protein